MTKQDIIKEGIKYELRKREFSGESLTATEYAEGIVRRLHSQGVVIKVDRELPLCPNQPADDGRIEGNFIKREAWISCRNQLEKAGYVAVEPLIEEKGIDVLLCPYCHHKHLPGNPHIKEEE